MSSGNNRRFGQLGLLAVIALFAAACRQDMHDQPKLEPLEASPIFQNGAGSRYLVEGTVARGQLRQDQVFYTGLTPEDTFATTLPIPLDRKLLERGQSRFNAFCSPCHGQTGDGRGMVVQRGFKNPTSFHDQRLVDSPVGYYFNAITNGFGQMSSYAAQIAPADRWAIAAYVKALQLSQSIPVEQLSAEEREKVIAAAEAPAEGPQEGH